MSLNQVQLIGNVGNAPEVLKKTHKGTFVRFSIATNKQFTNRQGETIQKVQWHKVLVTTIRLSFEKRDASICIRRVKL